MENSNGIFCFSTMMPNFISSMLVEIIILRQTCTAILFCIPSFYNIWYLASVFFRWHHLEVRPAPLLYCPYCSNFISYYISTNSHPISIGYFAGNLQIWGNKFCLFVLVSPVNGSDRCSINKCEIYVKLGQLFADNLKCLLTQLTGSTCRLEIYFIGCNNRLVVTWQTSGQRVQLDHQ